MCDPRVRGAVLFICMVAGLCWHFSNFPWLCKVFLQTFLLFASQFRNLKAILKLGGDFAAKWHFRRPFLKLGAFSQRGMDFAEEENSRSPFRSCKMSVRGFEMVRVCQKVVSQLRNSLRNGVWLRKLGVFYTFAFCNRFAATK